MISREQRVNLVYDDNAIESSQYCNSQCDFKLKYLVYLFVLQDYGIINNESKSIHITFE